MSSVRYGVSALWHFAPRGPVRPFAGLAVTTETIDYEPYLPLGRETETTGALTLGAHLPLAPRLSLRFQALQDVVGRSEHARREQLMLTAGLSYRQRVH